jgi:hypothetical protein
MTSVRLALASGCAAILLASAQAADKPVTTSSASKRTTTAAASPAPLFPDDPRTWSRAREAKTLSDLSKAQPAAALTDGRREKRKWKVIPYAAADLGGKPFEGKALSAFRDTEAPEVRLPLETAGPHAVYVGVQTCSAGLDYADENGVRVKLSNEKVYRRMSNGLPLAKPRRDQVQELFLGAAELAGLSLDIAPLSFKPATVSYVKLVPLTAAEFAAYNASPSPSQTRNAVATFDGHSWIWPYRPRTAEQLLENFRGLERSDYGKWWFQVCGADLTCYPSEVGNIPGADTQDFHRWEHKEYTESLQALFAAKVHPLRVARDEARRQGSEFHVMIRPTGFMASYPFDETFDSRFARAHPEWRCVDRDGTPTMHMSYAYPEVRKQVLAVLREALELEPEGVGYLFHRGMPMVLWEEPFLKEFRSRYGADAREVPEDDPRVLDLRAEMVTTLLKETRSLLDEVAARRGRKNPYTISLSTFSTEPDNRRHGLDVGRWAKEGLVDDVAVAFFAHHTSFKQPDMAYYKKLLDGSKAKLYPFVIAWNSGSPQQLCQRVTDFYTGGADGIAVWDPTVEAHYRDKSPGNVIDIASRVGRRPLIGDWAKRGPPQPPSIPLIRFGDNHYSRWFPNTGY